MDTLQALQYLRSEHQRIVQMRWMALGRARAGCVLTPQEALSIAIVEASSGNDYALLIELAERWKAAR